MQWITIEAGSLVLTEDPLTANHLGLSCSEGEELTCAIIDEDVTTLRFLSS